MGTAGDRFGHDRCDTYVVRRSKMPRWTLRENLGRR